MKRKEGEDFEQYQARRKADNILTRIKLFPKFVWYSLAKDADGNIVGRTYRKGRDQLMNSRADSAPDAPKRPAGDQAHNVREVKDGD
jgi:hypothetical protein